MQLKQLREPKPNKISFRTIYYSKKHPDPSQSAQIGESMLENAFITLLEHDPDVLEYLNQAVPKDNSGDFKPLTYRRSDGVIEEWTPDFTVIWRNGNPMIIEVKPLAVILKNQTFLIEKWRQTKDLAKQNNWDFYIFTDAYKSTSYRVDNLMDLESQLSFATKQSQEAIIEVISQKGIHFNKLLNMVGDQIVKMTWSTRKIQKQLAKIGFSQNEVLAGVFNLLYQNKLNIDLEKEFDIDTPLSISKTMYIPLKTWLREQDIWGTKLFEDHSNIVDENNLEMAQFSRLKRHRP